MATAIPISPDEETPLLGGQRVSAVGIITEPEPEATAQAGPSNQDSHTSSVGSETNTNVVKKTPLPWAQFSLVMFLQLAEPLTSQVIYPVSLPVVFPPALVSFGTDRTGLIAR